MNLAETAAEGDRLKTLTALRDYLAKALDDTDSARDQASLSARLMDVLAQIDEIDASHDEEDELADLVVLPGATG